MFENMNANQMGLLQTGLAILSNAYGPNARNAIGIGGLQGLQAMQRAKEDERDEKLYDARQKKLEIDTQQAQRQMQLQQLALDRLSGGPQQPGLMSYGMESDKPTLLGGGDRPAAIANAQAYPVGPSGAGSSTPASPAAPSGLLGMSLNDVVMLKIAGGPDVMDAWTLAQQGIEQKPGSSYIDPITKEVRFTPKVGEGVILQNGQAVPLPGYAQAQAEIQGAQANAQQEAAASRDLVQVPDGQGGTVFVTRSQLAEQARGGQAPTAEQSPRVRDASDITRLAAEAEQYLGAASSGMAQAAATGLGEAFGISSDASKADAQLRTIAGQLVSKMPRMEGPQSNVDVQLYREMAGDIANPRLPADTRKAALKTIIDLNAKYATPGASAEAAAPAPASGSDMAAPRSAAEYGALPSGTTFRAPDGSIRRKP